MIDNEPWFIAKEVANILGYKNTKDAINNHVDEQDQIMLSCSECKEIFGNLLAVDEAVEYSESVEGEKNLKGSKTLPLKDGISIRNFGMKLINEADQRMLSYEECKGLFGNNLEIEEDIEVTESIENTEDFKGAVNDPLEKPIKISNFGVKIINESGLYDLILEAKKKEAKAFRRIDCI